MNGWKQRNVVRFDFYAIFHSIARNSLTTDGLIATDFSSIILRKIWEETHSNFENTNVFLCVYANFLYNVLAK